MRFSPRGQHIQIPLIFSSATLTKSKMSISGQSESKLTWLWSDVTNMFCDEAPAVSEWAVTRGHKLNNRILILVSDFMWMKMSEWVCDTTGLSSQYAQKAFAFANGQQILCSAWNYSRFLNVFFLFWAQDKCKLGPTYWRESRHLKNRCLQSPAKLQIMAINHVMMMYVQKMWAEYQTLATSCESCHWSSTHNSHSIWFFPFIATWPCWLWLWVLRQV